VLQRLGVSRRSFRQAIARLILKVRRRAKLIGCVILVAVVFASILAGYASTVWMLVRYLAQV